MSETTTGILIIHYMDGTRQKYEFQRMVDQEKYKFTAGGVMKEAMAANHLLLDLEDRTVLIPFQNIKFLEFMPSAQRLPEYAIRGAKLMEQV
jgi:hypothetical protein